MLAIECVRYGPLNVPLHTPFGIAQGAQSRAENVWVEVVLSDGSVGLGEAAPFPAVNGETQSAVLDALAARAALWDGRSALAWRRRCAEAQEAFAETRSAGAALECALLDALTQARQLALHHFWGGAEHQLNRDITIPTGDVDAARHAAKAAADAGFSQLKIKVGAGDDALDAARVRAAHAHCPQAELIIDANAAFAADQAIRWLGELGAAREALRLFEQPVPREDLDGLARVQREGAVDVAADESARSVADVVALARHGIAVVNLKITKSGLLESLTMAQTARALGCGLMIGGMVETEITVSVSAALAASMGGFRVIDLDTPLFMAPRPLTGGLCTQSGPELVLSDAWLGHGIKRQAQ